MFLSLLFFVLLQFACCLVPVTKTVTFVETSYAVYQFTRTSVQKDTTQVHQVTTVTSHLFLTEDVYSETIITNQIAQTVLATTVVTQTNTHFAGTKPLQIIHFTTTLRLTEYRQLTETFTDYHQSFKTLFVTKTKRMQKVVPKTVVEEVEDLATEYFVVKSTQEFIETRKTFTFRTTAETLTEFPEMVVTETVSSFTRSLFSRLLFVLPLALLALQ